MKRLGKISILLVAIILFSAGYVYASGFNFLAETSTTTLEPGDTITINLGVSDIDAGELGINTIEAVLEYDKEVFEAVTPTNFTGLNNWSITYNNEIGENEGKFVAVIVQDGVTVDQGIGTLTLKVKDDVEAQSTSIVFKDIKTNDGVEEISTTDKTITLNVKEPEPIEPEQPEEPEEPQEPEEPEDTTSPDPIPQTGENIYIIITICTLAVLIMILAYILYRKNRDIK